MEDLEVRTKKTIMAHELTQQLTEIPSTEVRAYLQEKLNLTLPEGPMYHSSSTPLLDVPLKISTHVILSPVHSPVGEKPSLSIELPPAIQTTPFLPPPTLQRTDTPSPLESIAAPGPSVAAPLESQPSKNYATPFHTYFPNLHRYSQSAQFLYVLSSLIGPLHYSPFQPDYFPSDQSIPPPEHSVSPYTPTPLAASIPVHIGFTGPRRQIRGAGKCTAQKKA